MRKLIVGLLCGNYSLCTHVLHKQSVRFLRIFQWWGRHKKGPLPPPTCNSNISNQLYLQDEIHCFFLNNLNNTKLYFTMYNEYEHFLQSTFLIKANSRQLTVLCFCQIKLSFTTSCSLCKCENTV